MSSQGGSDAPGKNGGMMINTGHEITPSASNNFGPEFH